MQELLFKHPWCPSGPTGVFFPNQISRGLHHWCKGLWGVQRMPGACMCVQTGPDAYAWGPSQCRRVVMEGEREWSLHWFSCPRPSNYMAGAPWHTHQGWSLKSAQAWWHTHTLPHWSPQSKGRLGGVVYPQFINEEATEVQRAQLAQDHSMLGTEFEFWTFEDHICFLRFSVMLA